MFLFWISPGLVRASFTSYVISRLFRPEGKLGGKYVFDALAKGAGGWGAFNVQDPRNR